MPYRSREATYVAAPMFHGLGFTQMALSATLGSTTIVERRFNPERVLQSIDRWRPTALVVVPVMLARIVAVLEDQPGRYDTSSLRIVFCSGSQLEADLVQRSRRTIGEKLYNFYGSTEVAYATFATPEDLRLAPGTAGRVPFSAVVRLYDFDGRPVVGSGRTGRIFVGNPFQFDGYTGGGNKEVIDGLMSTGDVGHFDAAGRLFVDGRDDEMVVSGGENLFPGEVEELLYRHPAIDEVAAIGVPDEDFGQRLAVFVVRKPGHELTADEVRDYVKDNLARYKVPRDVTFLDELPAIRRARCSSGRCGKVARARGEAVGLGVAGGGWRVASGGGWRAELGGFGLRFCGRCAPAARAGGRLGVWQRGGGINAIAPQTAQLTPFCPGRPGQKGSSWRVRAAGAPPLRRPTPRRPTRAAPGPSGASPLQRPATICQSNFKLLAYLESSTRKAEWS